MITPIKPTDRPTGSTNLERAKRVPITSLYKGDLKQSGRVLMGTCPFHDDHNPSFALYESTNSFFCFAGCGGGDIITLYQKLHDVDFKTAIKELGR